jgi:ribonuclease D
MHIAAADLLPNLNVVTDFNFIESTADFERVVSHLKQEPMVAIDLEADSMYHFQEKVCLLQVATDEMVAIIDPLAIDDPASLGNVLADPAIRKVFHGADYDVRSLYRDFQFEINNLFDTQIACMFLGQRETGLEAVLQNYFDVRLNKKFQRKDWSQRPLPQEMIRYAANDVNFLLPLARNLIDALDENQRLSWVLEECELLSRVRPANNDGKPLFLNFKGAGRLNPKQLGILEALLQYRRQVAAKKDRPLFKIMGSQSIMQLVRSAPTNPAELQKSGALSKKQIVMYGDDLLERIKAALSIPDQELPHYPRCRPPVRRTAAPARVKKLKKWRDEKAGKLNLDASLLMNKALLNTIATCNPINWNGLESIEEMRDWQRESFGHDIINLLSRRKPAGRPAHRQRRCAQKRN